MRSGSSPKNRSKLSRPTRPLLIEWTEATWNPVTGCSKVSEGCANCYAERMARRLQAMGQPNYHDGFAVRTHPHMLDAPLQWKRPKTVFVNSMSDLFHHEVSCEFVTDVFETMVSTPRHRYQVLTKRSGRMLDLAPRLPWPDNVWAGVSVGSARHLDRVDHLRQVPAQTRFLSLEPLLGPIGDLDLTGIERVIVGGESGPGARPMDSQWVLEIRDLCVGSGVSFFFKQWGGVNKKRTGRSLQGRTWDELPRPVTT